MLRKIRNWITEKHFKAKEKITSEDYYCFRNKNEDYDFDKFIEKFVIKRNRGGIFYLYNSYKELLYYDTTHDIVERAIEIQKIKQNCDPDYFSERKIEEEIFQAEYDPVDKSRFGNDEQCNKHIFSHIDEVKYIAANKISFWQNKKLFFIIRLIYKHLIHKYLQNQDNIYPVYNKTTRVATTCRVRYQIYFYSLFFFTSLLYIISLDTNDVFNVFYPTPLRIYFIILLISLSLIFNYWFKHGFPINKFYKSLFLIKKSHSATHKKIMFFIAPILIFIILTVMIYLIDYIGLLNSHYLNEKSKNIFIPITSAFFYMLILFGTFYIFIPSLLSNSSEYTVSNYRYFYFNWFLKLVFHSYPLTMMVSLIIHTFGIISLTLIIPQINIDDIFDFQQRTDLQMFIFRTLLPLVLTSAIAFINPIVKVYYSFGDINFSYLFHTCSMLIHRFINNHLIFIGYDSLARPTLNNILTFYHHNTKDIEPFLDSDLNIILVSKKIIIIDDDSRNFYLIFNSPNDPKLGLIQIDNRKKLFALAIKGQANEVYVQKLAYLDKCNMLINTEKHIDLSLYINLNKKENQKFIFTIFDQIPISYLKSTNDSNGTYFIHKPMITGINIGLRAFFSLNKAGSQFDKKICIVATGKKVVYYLLKTLYLTLKLTLGFKDDEIHAFFKKNIIVCTDDNEFLESCIQTNSESMDIISSDNQKREYYIYLNEHNSDYQGSKSQRQKMVYVNIFKLDITKSDNFVKLMQNENNIELFIINDESKIFRNLRILKKLMDALGMSRYNNVINADISNYRIPEIILNTNVLEFRYTRSLLEMYYTVNLKKFNYDKTQLKYHVESLLDDSIIVSDYVTANSISSIARSIVKDENKLCDIEMSFCLSDRPGALASILCNLLGQKVEIKPNRNLIKSSIAGLLLPSFNFCFSKSVANYPDVYIFHGLAKLQKFKPINDLASDVIKRVTFDLHGIKEENKNKIYDFLHQNLQVNHNKFEDVINNYNCDSPLDECIIKHVLRHENIDNLLNKDIIINKTESDYEDLDEPQNSPDNIANISILGDGDDNPGSIAAVLLALTLTPINNLDVENSDRLALNINLSYASNCLPKNQTVEYLFGNIIRVQDERRYLLDKSMIKKIRAIKVKLVAFSEEWVKYLDYLNAYLGADFKLISYPEGERDPNNKPTSFLLMRSDQKEKFINYYLNIYKI